LYSPKFQSANHVICNLSNRFAPTARNGIVARNLTLSQNISKLPKSPIAKFQSANHVICNLSNRFAPTARNGIVARNLTLSQNISKLPKSPIAKFQSANHVICKKSPLLLIFLLF